MKVLTTTSEIITSFISSRMISIIMEKMIIIIILTTIKEFKMNYIWIVIILIVTVVLKSKIPDQKIIIITICIHFQKGLHKQSPPFNNSMMLMSAILFIILAQKVIKVECKEQQFKRLLPIQ